jgi:hypothetical protein
MALPTPEALTAIFKSAGFTAIESEVMQATALEAEGPDVFWDTAVSISGPLVAVLGSLPPDRQNAIRDDAIQTLRAMFPEGPIRLGGEVVVATGMNPG